MRRRAALVTGAGAGIGRAAALALASLGYDLVLSDLDAAAIAVTAERVDGLPAKAHTRAAVGDVCAPEVVADMFRRLDGLDLCALVHCAGLFPRRTFAGSTVEDFDRVMAVNLRAAFLLAKAAVPAMAGRGGALVFMTSGSGLAKAVADPMQAEFSLYGASKAALDRWALGIAGELARSGVVVNTLCPGAVVRTPGVAALGLESLQLRDAIPAERVGEAIAWLASRPEDGPVGQRLKATEFGRAWGPGSEPPPPDAAGARLQTRIPPST
jgi:3-oxoacyl-[acyl-carrier protein] reductase